MINDGLMAVFFFVVGLEIKRELVAGELRDRRDARCRRWRRSGGMVVPAADLHGAQRRRRRRRGLGHPDGDRHRLRARRADPARPARPARSRCSSSTLAIVDDIGAILVIAVFYSGGIELVPLAISGLIVAAVIAMRAGASPPPRST